MCVRICKVLRLELEHGAVVGDQQLCISPACSARWRIVWRRRRAMSSAPPGAGPPPDQAPARLQRMTSSGVIRIGRPNIQPRAARRQHDDLRLDPGDRLGDRRCQDRIAADTTATARWAARSHSRRPAPSASAAGRSRAGRAPAGWCHRGTAGAPVLSGVTRIPRRWR